jgi:hypothetical protein
MARALRITLMWLLTLAVPVHGFAAASMLGCAGSQQRVAALAGAHSHASGHHGDGAVMHTHSHDGEGAEMAQAEHHPHGDAGSDADAHKGHTDGKASCSACAACCASAALPATPVVFEPTTLAPDSFVLPAPQHVAHFISGGLERPPRSIRA